MIQQLTFWLTILRLHYRARKLTWEIARMDASNALLRREIQVRLEYLQKLKGSVVVNNSQ